MVGALLSNQHRVENVTPQGCLVSPTIFSLINDIFENIPAGMERSLFADDRAL